MKYETVASFAKALRLPTQVLIEQLNRAGLSHKSTDAIITRADKNVLLFWLRRPHQAKSNQEIAQKIIRKDIYALIDAGYINKDFFKALKSHQDITGADSINILAELSVISAYSEQDTRSAQALIELLPQSLQRSLADWFNTLGLPSTRLLHPLKGLPNSLWMVSRPINAGPLATVIEFMKNTPVSLKESGSN